MALQVPAYQAAGAAKMFLEEAELASIDLGVDMERGIAAGEAMEELYDGMSDSCRLEVANLVQIRMGHMGQRLDAHAESMTVVLAFFEKAFALSSDHRNVINMPSNVADLILSYMDEAFENFIDCIYVEGASAIFNRKLSRDDIVATIPRFQPRVLADMSWAS